MSYRKLKGKPLQCAYDELGDVTHYNEYALRNVSSEGINGALFNPPSSEYGPPVGQHCPSLSNRQAWKAERLII